MSKLFWCQFKYIFKFYYLWVVVHLASITLTTLALSTVNRAVLDLGPERLSENDFEHVAKNILE